MSWAGLMVAGALALSGQQDGPGAQAMDTGPVTDLGEIRAEATLEQRARTFVQEAVAPPRGRRTARWDRDICIRVANMDPQYAQFMIDRISDMAAGLGLKPGEPGCRPNIIIASTNDGPLMAQTLVESMETDMRPVLGISDRGRAAFQAFQTSEAPVRWWHVSLPYDVDTGDLALGTMRVRQVSRLRSNTREDLARVMVILDVSRIGRVSFGALSDYVAMVVLTQADPEGETSGYDTILNLFRSEDRSAVLTEWDRGFLTALYSASRDRPRQASLAREIAGRMADGQRRPDAPVDQP